MAPGIRRAGVCANGDRRETVLAGFRDGLRQSFDRQPKALIGWHYDDSVPSYADDPGRPLDRRMRLVAQEDCRPVGGARLLAGGDQRVEDCGRPAGGEEATCRFGVADPLTDPVDDDQLELAGTAGAEPGPLEGIEPGGEIVGDHAGPGRGRGHEGKEARMIDACGDGKHVSYRALEHGERILALFGCRFAQERLERRARRSSPGCFVPQPFEPRNQLRRCGVGKSAHVFSGHAEIGFVFAGHPAGPLRTCARCRLPTGACR